MAEAAAKAALQEPVIQIPIKDVNPSPFNPRKHFDKEYIGELAKSIAVQGIIEPLIVKRVVGDQYELVIGESRLRAAQQAKLASVPCIVRNYTDEQAREAQIVENLQRRNIAPLEEAQAFQDLLKLHNDSAAKADKVMGGAVLAAGEAREKLVVATLADRVGKSKEYVYGRLKLLKLSPPVQKALAAEKISASHAVELVPLKPEQQKEMLDEIEAGEANANRGFDPLMSVQDLRAEIADRYREKPAKAQADIEREAKWKKQEAQRRKKWEAEEKRRKAENGLRLRADSLALQQLFPKLEAASGPAAQRLVDVVLGDAWNSLDRAEEACLIAAGKPIEFDKYVSSNLSAKGFAAKPFAERLALVVLAMAVNRIYYEDRELAPIWAWAKIDRKKILAQVKAEDAAAEKKAQAATKLAKAKFGKSVLPTSAKAPKPAKPAVAGRRAKKAGKARAKKAKK